MTATRVASRIRVLHILARMNVGGPASQVSLLAGRLPADRYDVRIATGHLGIGEGSFEHLAERYGARMETIEALGPEIQPMRDLSALLRLASLVRTFRPHVVHTHTAKAGMLGRVAARVALGPRVKVVHTYHGHVLSGYFSPWRSAVFRSIERVLALLSDRLVAVSAATADELARMRVAARERFAVVPVGLELDPFLAISADEGARLRSEIGAEREDCVVLMLGRLVPVKRVDVALDAVAAARSRGARVKLVLAGDGTSRASLEAQASRLALGDAVRFLGFRDDVEALIAGADVALLTSDNEGLPVALIEAAAGATPAVASDVGGVAEIVTDTTGRLTPPGDARALADALVELADDPALRHRLGGAAREHVRAVYSVQRLLRDIDGLYGSLLGTT